MKLTASVALIVSSLFAGDGQTIKTSDGETYTNAEITELRPSGAVIQSDSGVASVPYTKLPKEFQARYGYDAEELTRHLKNGLDGNYFYRDAIAVFAGEVIDLKEGQFTYSTFSDVGPLGEDRSLHGRYTVAGNWLILHHPKIQIPNRVIAIIGDRVALLVPHEYKMWKDSGKPSNFTPLTREKSK